MDPYSARIKGFFNFPSLFDFWKIYRSHFHLPVDVFFAFQQLRDKFPLYVHLPRDYRREKHSGRCGVDREFVNIDCAFGGPGPLPAPLDPPGPFQTLPKPQF